MIGHNLNRQMTVQTVGGIISIAVEYDSSRALRRVLISLPDGGKD